MHIMYFTEQPYTAWAEGENFFAEIPALGTDRVDRVSTLLLSNSHFRSSEAARLYQERLNEYRYVDEMGFDGIMLNEHHTAPFCMSPRINIMAAVVAMITQRVRLVLLGNPLPIWDNPVHLGEELALIDLLSQGRLVSGFVRGAGVETLQANVNPLHNRERFEEAHDLLMKSWTQPGPFRWEGKHYQHRVVNPWTLPLQRPHPPIWVPGLASKETVVWAARKRYPYLGLTTNIALSAKIKQMYRDIAAEEGYTPDDSQFGLVIQCHVATTAAKAEENARQFTWMQDLHMSATHPIWGSPTGYGSPNNRKALIEVSGGIRPPQAAPTLEQRRQDGTLVYGTPDQVIPQLISILEKNPVGILGMQANDGMVSHEDSLSCIRLLGTEVLPAVREYARKAGLRDPLLAEIAPA